MLEAVLVAKRRIARRLVLAASVACGFAAGRASAQQPTTAEAAPQQPAELERLLTLPSGERFGVDRRGGLSRGEWRARFNEIATALANERQALADAEGRLGEAAGSASNWQMAPVPGMQPSPDAPLDYQLRVAIRRHRSEIERLEKKLRQLEIEANLAGVPPEWRS
jgi:hypothetical protein